MPGPGAGSAHNSVLERFRKQQVRVSQTLDASAKERSARLAKQRQAKAARVRRAESATSSADVSQSSRRAGASSWRGPPSPAASGRAASGGAPARPLPLGMRQKRVVDCLRAVGRDLSAAEIREACGVDVASDGALLRELRANARVSVRGGWEGRRGDDEGRAGEGEGRGEDESGGASTLSPAAVAANLASLRLEYRPEVQVRSKAQLLSRLRGAARPLSSKEAADAYPGAEADVQAMVAQGLVIPLRSHEPDLACDVLFATDQKLQSVRVDDDLVDLWLSTPLPSDESDLVAQVAAAGLRPAPRRAAPKAGDRLARKKKTKARKQQRIRALTNTHLSHLLTGDQPQTID